MKLSAMKIDAARRDAGAWVGKIPEFPGVRFHVRGFGSPEHKAIRARELEKFPANHELSQDEQRAVINAAIREGLLLGWEGIEDEGQPWPYSPENVELVLTHPDFELWREAVVYCIDRVARATQAELEADAKN